MEVKQLAKDFACYLYLPRLQTTAVLTEAIVEGVRFLTWAHDAFAYAESYDEAAGRYRGLKGGQMVHIASDAPVGLIVKPERALRQLDEETRHKETAVGGGNGREPSGDGGRGPGRDKGTGCEGDAKTGGAQPRPQPKRFHGTVRLDPGRTGRDAGKVGEEVLAHRVGLPGAAVTVTLEISARIPEGASEHLVRILTENCRTLKFDAQGFELE